MMQRRIGAGFLAGASSVASLLVLIAALLMIAGIFGLIRDISSGVFGDISLSAAMAQSMGSSLQTFPSYFWSARWAMVALGVAGIALALADVWRVRIDRPWRDSLGWIVTNGLVGLLVFASLYLNLESILRTIAEQPNLYSTQGLLLVSDATLLGLGLLATLGFGYVVWTAWQWWYDCWAGWLRVERPPSVEASQEAATPVSSSDDWRAYQERLMRLKRQEGAAASVEPVVVAPACQSHRSWLPAILGAIVVTSLAIVVVLRLYHGSAMALVSGEFWLQTDVPAAAFRLDFPATPRTITFSNTSGAGTVDLQLSDSTQRLKTLDGMALADGPGYSTQSLDLAGLSAGAYRVDAQLTAGSGGLIRYVGLYGGGVAAQVFAVLLGVMSAAWMVAASVFLLEIFVRRSRSAA